MNNTRIDELIAQARIPAYDIALSDLQELVRVVVMDCIDACDNIAAEADQMANNDVLTMSGKTLYQGMWGGASNSAARIRHNYGVE